MGKERRDDIYDCEIYFPRVLYSLTEYVLLIVLLLVCVCMCDASYDNPEQEPTKAPCFCSIPESVVYTCRLALHSPIKTFSIHVIKQQQVWVLRHPTWMVSLQTLPRHPPVRRPSAARPQFPTTRGGNITAHVHRIFHSFGDKSLPSLPGPFPRLPSVVE